MIIWTIGSHFREPPLLSAEIRTRNSRGNRSERWSRRAAGQLVSAMLSVSAPASELRRGLLQKPRKSKINILAVVDVGGSVAASRVTSKSSRRVSRRHRSPDRLSKPEVDVSSNSRTLRLSHPSYRLPREY